MDSWCGHGMHVVSILFQIGFIKNTNSFWRVSEKEKLRKTIDNLIGEEFLSFFILQYFYFWLHCTYVCR
jgi:hypothetical protein